MGLLKFYFIMMLSEDEMILLNVVTFKILGRIWQLKFQVFIDFGV